MKHTLIARAKAALDFWHWREQGLAYLVALAAFTLLGPFSTFDMPLGQRALFWGVTLLAGWASMMVPLMVVLRHPAFDDWHAGFRVGLAVLMATAPITYAVREIQVLMGLEERAALILPLMIRVLLIGLLIGGLVYLRVSSRLGLSEKLSAKGPSSFLKRLPYDVGDQILSLSTQDHYVEVTTTKGTALILVRFQDAIEELGQTGGVQIHRSHWVAQGAMRKLKRHEGKLMVELIDGRVLPVSRTYAQTVRAVLS